jgi:hypothetical protein
LAAILTQFDKKRGRRNAATLVLTICRWWVLAVPLHQSNEHRSRCNDAVLCCCVLYAALTALLLAAPLCLSFAVTINGLTRSAAGASLPAVFIVLLSLICFLLHCVCCYLLVFHAQTDAERGRCDDNCPVLHAALIHLLSAAPLLLPCTE